jgi:undecaprenyl-diphosphatase
MLVVLTAVVTPGQATGLDHTVQAWSDNGRPAAGMAVAGVLLLLASVAPYVLTLGVGVVMWRRRRRLAASILVGGFVVSILLTMIVKLATDRARPPSGGAGLPAAGDEASFPSSSVVSCVAFWTLAAGMALATNGFHGRTRALAVVAAALTALVGPTRLYVGGHWFTDIVGGYLLAAVTVSASVWLYLRSSRRPIGSPDALERSMAGTPPRRPTHRRPAPRGA